MREAIKAAMIYSRSYVASRNLGRTKSFAMADPESDFVMP
jgi:hypothetical protein